MGYNYDDRFGVDEDDGQHFWPDSGMDATDAITDRGDPYEDERYEDYDSERWEPEDALPTLQQAIRDQAPGTLTNNTLSADITTEYNKALKYNIQGTYDLRGFATVSDHRGTEVREVDKFVSNFPIRLNDEDLMDGFPEHNAIITRAVGPDGNEIKNQSDTVAYAICAGGRMGYVEYEAGVVVFPQNRSQAELIHRSASLAMVEGKDWNEINRVISSSARALGIRCESYEDSHF